MSHYDIDVRCKRCKKYIYSVERYSDIDHELCDYCSNVMAQERENREAQEQYPEMFREWKGELE